MNYLPYFIQMSMFYWKMLEFFLRHFNHVYNNTFELCIWNSIQVILSGDYSCGIDKFWRKLVFLVFHIIYVLTLEFVHIWLNSWLRICCCYFSSEIVLFFFFQWIYYSFWEKLCCSIIVVRASSDRLILQYSRHQVLPSVCPCELSTVCSTCQYPVVNLL